MVDVRVHAAARDEPEQVHARAALECEAQRLVLEEVARLDRLVHAHQILEQDPPRADRQVADLGVAHLSGRQAYGLPGRGERRVRVSLPQAVEDRSLRQRDGVAGARRRAAPAVENDEDYEGIRAAVSHIARKESMSSEAPPTSAPSTSGCANNPAVLSGLTDPPYTTGTSRSDLISSCACCAISGVAV